ncbi:acetolactate synthase [Blattabacterium cuenoti]|uniref:Acetolactate synthase small subunit n=1 Tax=Blattabacterium cuenoti STAT TaxID=1457030 RepID=A0A224AAZ2_9FLAO|nr:acetolactate synthase [Blattabacterium cuenoti]BBA17025.1 acetolactate synthase small subunit [Blattabacterium cuenoti STAT]
MKNKFRIIILGEKETRLLSRILIIFNRKNIKTDHINISNKNKKKPIDTNNQYVIDLKCKEDQLFKIKKLIEKLIGIIHVYSYKLKEKIYEKKWIYH